MKKKNNKQSLSKKEMEKLSILISNPNYYGDLRLDADDKEYITPKNKQFVPHAKFLLKHGFDPTETFNLDITLSLFLLKRLKYFAKNIHGIPSGLKTKKEWVSIIKEIIWALEFHLNEDEMISKFVEKGDKDKLTKSFKRMNQGFEYLGKYFCSLWD